MYHHQQGPGGLLSKDIPQASLSLLLDVNDMLNAALKRWDTLVSLGLTDMQVCTFIVYLYLVNIIVLAYAYNLLMHISNFVTAFSLCLSACLTLLAFWYLLFFHNGWYSKGSLLEYCFAELEVV